MNKMVLIQFELNAKENMKLNIIKALTRSKSKSDALKLLLNKFKISRR